MPSFDEIFGSQPAAPKKGKAVSFDDIFGPAHPSVPFANQPADTQVGELDMALNPMTDINGQPMNQGLVFPDPNVQAPAPQPLPKYPRPDFIPNTPYEPEMPEYDASDDPNLEQWVSDAEHPGREAGREWGEKIDDNLRDYDIQYPKANMTPDEEFQHAQKMSEYFADLPVPMDAAIMSDPELGDHYRTINELILGRPLANVNGEERSQRQQQITQALQEMEAAGVDDPIEWVQMQEAQYGPQWLPVRSAMAFGEGIVDGSVGLIENTVRAGADMIGIDDALGGKVVQQRRDNRAAFEEGVEEQKDKQSYIGEFGASVVRQASGAVGEMVPAAAAAAITKNPNVSIGMMSGGASAETYNSLRAQGWDKFDALTYSAATGGIEALTEKMGLVAAKAMGWVNLNNAFTASATKAFAEGMKRSGLKRMSGIAGSILGEGTEEVVAEMLGSVKDAFAGIDPALFGSKPASEQITNLAKTFAIGGLAGLAGNVPAAAAFLLDPNRKTAKAAGLDTRAFDEELLKDIAAGAADLFAKKTTQTPTQPVTPAQEQAGVAQSQAAWSDIAPEAPSEPVQAPPQNVAPEPSPAPEAPQEPAQEVVSPAEPASEPAKPNPLVTPDKTPVTRVMGVDMRRRANVTTGGVKYEFYEGETEAAIRTVDADTGEVVTVKKYPDINAAREEFARVTTGASDIADPVREQPVPKPAAKAPEPTPEPAKTPDREWAKPSGTSHPKADIPLTKFEEIAYKNKQETNARIRRQKGGVGASEGKGWIADAWRRRPEWAKTPADFAEWIEGPRGGFDIGPYYKYLDREGITLEQAVVAIQREDRERYEQEKKGREGIPFVPGEKPVEPAKPKRKLYQGRGATPEEVYGKEAVDAGRAVPLFGPGEYYASNKEDAANYGKDISERDDVELKKPFVLDSDAKWKDLLEKSGADHLDNMGPKFYQDPKGVPGATEKLQAYIKSLGHDGIEVKLSGENTRRLEAMVGHDQTVVFGEAKKPEAAKPKVDYGTIDKPNRVTIGEHMGEHLKAGKGFKTIIEARKAASELIGEPVKPGTPASKAVDEAVELGVVIAAREIINTNRKDPGKTFDALLDLYERQPVLGQRSSTSMRDQAYSTPAPLAFVAQHLAGVNLSTLSVFDSSAGNGMLLTAGHAGSSYANELNPDRAAALESQGLNTTTGDATAMSGDKKFDKIIINPPFGRVEEDGKAKHWVVDGVRTEQVDHAITLKTLEHLKEGGKATIIIGSKGFEKGAPKEDVKRAAAYSAQKKFYDKLYGEYNVVDHFTVSGDLYSRQGASFPVDVIVVDGKGKAARPKPWEFQKGGIPQVFDSWEGLKDAKLNSNTSVSSTGNRSESTPRADHSDVGGLPSSTGVGSEPTVGAEPKPARSDSDSVGGKARGGTRVPKRSGPRKPSVVPGVADQPREPERVPDGSQQPGGSGGGTADAGGLAPGDPVSPEALDALMEAEINSISKPPEKKKPAAKSTISKKAEKARADADAAVKDFLDALRKDISPSSTGFNPELLKLAAKAAVALSKAGTLTFAEFVEKMAKAAPDMLDAMTPYLESAWRVVHKNDTTGKIGPAGKVSDVIKPAAKAEAKAEEPKAADVETEFQTTYTPRSKGRAVGTLLPANHVTAVARALDAIEETYGDIDKFVAKETGFKPEQMERLSAEQVDALAMAIANDKRGQAFIIGDQTGVGKGRIVAGMIAYAKKKGLVPIFVTEKPSLYADLMRDLTALGMNPVDGEFNPLMTNGLVGEDKIDLNNQVEGRGPRVVAQGTAIAKRMMAEAVANQKAGKGLVATKNRKELPYDAIFTTYSQLNPVKGAETWRHANLRALMPNAYLILDESHNAGGSAASEDDRWEDDKITRSELVREMVQSAGNVFYSSATFAKRPDVMDLYSRAGIAQAIADVTKLPELMENGGVPLQQVLSEMLAEAGLYLRRERSYDGVEFEPETAEVDLDTADKAAGVFRTINHFSDAMQEAVKEIEKDIVGSGGKLGDDTATGGKGVTSTSFSSILWNVTSQMLFALKADKAAQKAIDSWKAGESPVIVVDETMETKLREFVDAHGLSKGDLVDYSFRDLLRNYLERSREILIKEDVSDPKSWTRRRLTDDELGSTALEYYNAADKLIDSFDSELPASPIDWMRHRMKEAGMKVAEITGRSTMLDYATGINSPTLIERSSSELGNTGKGRTVNGFNDGSIDAVIINRSGSTGLSLHANKGFKNQKQRHMIIAQPAKNIDEFMQALGRVHRTGQTKVPKYTLFLTNAPAENRPAAILVKKLASLNANVTASAKGSVSFDVPDVINEIGDRVVLQWMMEHMDLNQEMGNPVKFNDNGLPGENPDIARKVSGRVALLPVKTQQEFWDDIVDAFNQTIEELNAYQANPLVATTLDLQAKTEEKFAITQPRGDDANDPFQQPASLEKVLAKNLGRPLTSTQVQEAVAKFYDSEDIQAAKKKWITETEADLKKETLAWLEARIKELEKKHAPKDNEVGKAAQKRLDEQDAAIRSLRDAAQRQYGLATENIRYRPPGTVIAINLNGEVLRGVVTNIQHKSKSGNPSATSKWTVTLALADGVRQLKFPLSRLNAEEFGYAVLGEMPNEFKGTKYGEMFDSAQSESKEVRHIGTGNILAGFDMLNEAGGKIVFYTDASGQKQRGVLMPKNFNPTKWQESRPINFKTGTKLLDFLKLGGNARTADGVVLFAHMGDNLVIRAPKARSRSGQYTTSDAILKAGKPSEFHTKGGVAEMVVPPGRQQVAVLDAFLKLSGIQTTTERDLARSLGNDYHAMKAGLPRAISARAVTNPTRQTRSTAHRIPGEEKQAIAAQDIIKTLERMFQVPLRTDGFRSKAAGIYKVLPEVVRLRQKHVASLGVAMHEIGHHIDKKTGIANRKTTPLDPIVQNELSGLDYEPKNRLFEGFAEFVRMWVTEENAAKKAPMFNRYFENVFLKENPELSKQLHEARKYCRRFADQSVFKRLQSLIGGVPQDLSYGERLKERLSKGMSRFMHNQVDKYHGLKVVSEDLKAAGYRGPSPYDMSMALDMTGPANAATMLEHGVHSIRDGSYLGGPALWDAAELVTTKEEYDEAVLYAMARHILWYRKNISAKYNGGMDPADALTHINKMEQAGKKDRYEAFAKIIAEYANGLLDMQVDAGAITRETRDKLVKQYGDYYFPLERAKEKQAKTAGAGFVNLPPAMRRRSSEGSGARVLDPFDSLTARTLRDVSRAIKARQMNTLVQALDPKLGGMEGFGGVLDRVQPKQYPNVGKIAELLTQLVGAGVIEADRAEAIKIADRIRAGMPVSAGRLSWFLNRHGLDPLTADDSDALKAANREPDGLEEVAFWRNDWSPNHGKRIVLHHDPDGTPVLYELDEEIYRIATAMDEHELNAAEKIMRKGGEFFKMGAISLNTTFAGLNAIRDYITYQGRATEVKGLRTIVDPIAGIAEYVAAKSFGLDNALVTLIDQTGGKINTRLGDDIANRKIRKKKMFKKNTDTYQVLPSPLAILNYAKEKMQDLIALSDMPPRIAEMKAAIANEGYTYKGEQWIDMETGKEVDHLPEHVRIRAMLAFANATVNFKPGGTAAAKREAYLPLSRATVNSVYRQAQLAGNLKNLAKRGTKGDQARRYFIYNSLLAGASMVYWGQRHDDDDYREMEEFDRRGWWSIGWGGETVFRIPKPRDETVLMSAVEGLLDSIYHPDDAISLAQTAQGEVMDRIPMGAGAVRGLFEVFTGYDYFRQREITPGYIKAQNVPTQYQFDNYTAEWSKSLAGNKVAATLGISPIELQHLLNSTTGGAYTRYADMYDALEAGGVDNLTMKNVPVVGRMFPNRHQARSVNDFYSKQREVHEAANRDEIEGRKSGNKAEFDRLNGYDEMMAAIRKLEPKDYKGRRGYEYQSYIVGLAREALRREPLEANPSPFTAKDLPPAIHAAVKEVATLKAKRALLSQGRPEVADKRRNLTFQETVQDWQERRREATEWLKAHKDSDAVQEAVSEMMADERFLRALRPRVPRGASKDAVDKSGLTRAELNAYNRQGWEEDKQQAEDMKALFSTR